LDPPVPVEISTWRPVAALTPEPAGSASTSESMPVTLTVALETAAPVAGQVIEPVGRVSSIVKV